ncbi:hypothetical protein ACQ4PT_068451 [Festuca glaucescens]
MEWALSELLRRPDAAAAASEELDRVVGRGRWAEERDLEHLPYIDAVVKETMRLHPVGPLLVPHMAREHTVVAGYDIPAGARVLVKRVGHCARPGVVARPARRVPAGTVHRERRGRARAALRAAAVRRRAAYLPGARPGNEGCRRRFGEPAARVRVAAA